MITVNRPFVRFLLSGGLNTVATYVLYIGLLRILSYRVSYTVAFCAGVALSYELNRIFVFRAKRTLGSAAMTPIIYLLQYGVGIGVTTVSVEQFGLRPQYAPIPAAALTIPLTFLLMRRVFRQRDETRV